MSPAEVTFLTNPVCSKCYYIRIDDDCKHFYLHTKSNVDRKWVNTIFYIYMKPMLWFNNYYTPLTFLKKFKYEYRQNYNFIYSFVWA